jgi:hypothetical protein
VVAATCNALKALCNKERSDLLLLNKTDYVLFTTCKHHLGQIEASGKIPHVNIGD